ACEVERVAVGRRTHDVLGADRAAGASAALDHERLAQHFGETVGSEPREYVGDAARAVGHDDFHGTRRPILRIGDACSRSEQRRRQQTGKTALHPHRSSSRFALKWDKANFEPNSLWMTPLYWLRASSSSKGPHVCCSV